MIYAPVRSMGETRWKQPELSYVKYHLHFILHSYHRLLFRTKILKIYKDLCKTVNLATIRVIHAHFLYSDGAVALKIKQRHGIPYIVAVRNTDINAFMRYRPDLCLLRDKILQEASHVIFISPAYHELLSHRIGRSLYTKIHRRFIVVPNGVEASWLQVTPPSLSREFDGVLRLLYVGNFSKNKNIPGLLKAALSLSTKRPVHLTLVGGGGDGSSKVRQLLDSDKYRFAEYIGRVTDKEHLRAIYRQHDIFVMPSFKETFGVVYIEALSQGVPVVHSRDQGVDGYFTTGLVSAAVNPVDPFDIASKIETLADRCPSIRQHCIESAKRFDWEIIADTYSSLYDSSVSGYT